MAPADRRNQGSHKTKGDDMQKTFNKFLLVGDVTLGPDNRAKVECSEIGPNRVYTENLVIVGDDTTEIKAGRGKIEGRLQTAFTKDGRPRTIMACTRFKKVKKDTLSWGLVRIEDEIFRFVAFSGLAHRLDKGNSKMPPAKKGAEIQVQGRLRIREYENNGEIQKMTEVVCDPDWTLVTKPAEIVDVFADDADAQAFDDDAGDAEASDAI
jgi:hypothetical protein